jgi:TRAP-type uncharacterized transport system fused permease subunit
MPAKDEAPVRQEVKEDFEKLGKYDPELRFRQITGISAKYLFIMTQILSIFHIYTAGFGVLQEWRHRAFHLAFVLPLTYLSYTVRKDHTERKKYLFYDLIYAAIGSSLITAMLREILELSLAPVVATALLSFLLLLYFKRREFLGNRVALYVDFPVFTLMVIGIFLIFFVWFRDLDFRDVFVRVNYELFFWSIFLIGTLFAVAVLFVSKWLYALVSIVKRKTFTYDHDNIPYFGVFCAVLSSIVSVYVFVEFNTLVLRAGLPTRLDLVMGCFATLLVLEGARRSIGAPLPLIAYLVLVNCYLGPYFLDIPGLSFFAHRGYSIARITEHMYLGTEGIFGIPLGVVATFVFHFVLFGIFISKTGLGQLFIDMAMALTGWSVGGPAKVAVISSMFFGSISGSSVANTVTTGSFTIPLMKKVGYRAQFAGAVEAASSTGGQLMPPIMGAAAFIMAEFLNIPYVKIATAAIVPACLHFFAVGLMVHLEALRTGLLGLPREELPKVKAVLKERGLLVLPLIIIVYLLVTGTSPFLAAFWGIIYCVSTGQIHSRTIPFLVTVVLAAPCVLRWGDPFAEGPLWEALWAGVGVVGFILTFRRTDLLTWGLGVATTVLLAALLVMRIEPSMAAFWALIAVIGVGVFYKESKMRIPDILNTLEWGTKNALAIGAACACVGFIVGATTLTGLGLKFAAAVIQLAQGTAGLVQTVDVTHLLTLEPITLFFTLVYTAVACFILGMGIPTTAQYIIASMIAAPALLKWGIPPLCSHMFVLFYAVLADVTPPVALAAYAASGVSGADPFRTGFTAFGLSSAELYVPFAFVYSPILLWLPKILDPKASFNFVEFALVLTTIVLGVVALGSTIVGYLREKSTVPERVATGVSAFALLIHEVYSSLIGAAILLVVYALQRLRARKRALAKQGASG